MFVVELTIKTSNLEEYERVKNTTIEYFFKANFLINEKEKGYFEFKSFDEKAGFSSMLDIFDYLFYEEWFITVVESCYFYISKKGKISFYRDVLDHYLS